MKLKCLAGDWKSELSDISATILPLKDDGHISDSKICLPSLRRSRCIYNETKLQQECVLSIHVNVCDELLVGAFYMILEKVL